MERWVSSYEKTACGIVQAALEDLDTYLAYGTITDIWKDAKATYNKNKKSGNNR